MMLSTWKTKASDSLRRRRSSRRGGETELYTSARKLFRKIEKPHLLGILIMPKCRSDKSTLI